MYRLYGQVLPETLVPADYLRIKPAPTGILFARNLLIAKPLVSDRPSDNPATADCVDL
jgi:hypothetical protein